MSNEFGMFTFMVIIGAALFVIQMIANFIVIAVIAIFKKIEREAKKIRKQINKKVYKTEAE